MSSTVKDGRDERHGGGMPSDTSRWQGCGMMLGTSPKGSDAVMELVVGAVVCVVVRTGWWLVVGGWWLVAGGWWLVVDGWWLVVGGWWWLVVVGGG